MPDPLPAGYPAPPRPQGGTDYLYTLNRDLKALNASVLVITQKIKYLVRNEKILGRNLIIINKRVKELSTSLAQTQGEGMSDETKQLVSDLSRQASALSSQLVQLESRLDTLSRSAAKQDEVKELKYIIDGMNPLHYVTREQVEELIDKRLGERKK
ncbi:MAG: hypothetical protein Q8P05_04475 [Candidatus Diapherotrites archaeon]|nr:hypothetical protein [Candidatus Diapherotrites archaeon]MDZ4256627.1 hypothetical protein [archaeon]